MGSEAEEAFKKVVHALGLQAAGINDTRTCTLAAREALDALPALKPPAASARDWKADYDAAMTEIGEIVRVARDNPKGLECFLKMNFPREWGLSKEEHREMFKDPKALADEMGLPEIERMP